MSEGQGQFEAEIRENRNKEDKMARDGKFKVIDEGISICQVKGGKGWRYQQN